MKKKTTKKLTPVQRVLTKAADLIREYGWVQKRMGNETIGFCSIGAISAATKGFILRERARKLLHDAMDGIIGYNDATGRTKSEVLRKFRQAIKAGGKS